MTTKQQTNKEKVEDQFNWTLERLQEYDPVDIVEWPLELRRKQTLVNGEWQTRDYVLVLTTGGPHVEVDTSGTISVSWGNSYLEHHVPGAVQDKLDEVFNIIDEEQRYL